jgi:DNA modification methylase
MKDNDKKIEQVATASLVPYAKNAKKHDAAQVAAIAGSIREFGFNNPVLIDADNGIIAGHGRVLAAHQLGLDAVPCLRLTHLSDTQKRAYILADNRLAELGGGWDAEMLAAELESLSAEGITMEEIGFDADALEELGAGLDDEGNPEADAEPQIDRAEELRAKWGVEEGQLWELGEHRLLCGDSTSGADVQKVIGEGRATLIHADPPYGMGKEAEGVLNDNLYKEKLDAFQMQWWKACRSKVEDNGSAYIWGNAPDLWRLWYLGGLGNSERLELRNEIVWDKKSIPGMASDLMTQYPEASERCLFFQIGQQFIGNINADDFPEQWEPLRSYMSNEAESCGLSAKKLKQLCGVSMFGHWFTRSQFTLVPKNHYETIQMAYPDNFKKSWAQLKTEWDCVKGSGRKVINGKLEGMRSYFDNAHEAMRDVWEHGRVVGGERHGHATPKPVSMICRCIKSSAPVGGIVYEPFLGSGSTLMACEQTSRKCRAIEISPAYVAVALQRWADATGKTPKLVA